MTAMLQAKLQVLLLGGSDVLAQTAELRTELQGAAAHNKAQLAASLRGVEMLQGPDGADPKLLAMSKLHMVGEVLGALFERLHKRDAKQARAQAVAAGKPGGLGLRLCNPKSPRLLIQACTAHAHPLHTHLDALRPSARRRCGSRCRTSCSPTASRRGCPARRHPSRPPSAPRRHTTVRSEPFREGGCSPTHSSPCPCPPPDSPPR